MKRPKTPVPPVANTAPASLDEVKVVLVSEPDPQRHFQKQLKAHHYLGSLKPVGERMFYAAVDGRPVSGPQTKVHAGDGGVSAPQQQPVHALAQPTKKAPTQNHHRLLQRHERRASSLRHSLPPCPSAKLPNRFVNWP